MLFHSPLLEAWDGVGVAGSTMDQICLPDLFSAATISKARSPKWKEFEVGMESTRCPNSQKNSLGRLGLARCSYDRVVFMEKDRLSWNLSVLYIQRTAMIGLTVVIEQSVTK